MRKTLFYTILALLTLAGDELCGQSLETEYSFLEGSQEEVAENSSINNGLIRRLMNFFDKAGEDRSFERRVDLDFLGGIGYSQEKGFGISANMSGGYRVDKSDSLASPSWFNLTLSAALNDFYSVESAGRIYIGDNNRIDHFLEYSSGRRDLWGVGYNAGLYNSAINYRLNSLIANWQYRLFLCEDFSLGVILDYRLYRGFGIHDSSYVNGEPTSYNMGGVGLLAEFDSRDDEYSANKGLYALMRAVAYPKGMSDVGGSFYKWYVNLAAYQPLWSGGVLAAGFQGEFSNGETPWLMLSGLGDYGFMRGYYIGRFVDTNAASVQVELRQHIWWRVSGAVWAGCGNMYSSLDEFRWEETLPSYGVGGRFRASSNSVVRLDVGFGRDTFGVFLRYSEAF